MRCSDLGLEPLGELHGDVHVSQAEESVVDTVAVDGPADLVPDHALPALLLGEGQSAGARAGLAPGGWPAADTEPGGVRAVLLLPVLQPHHLPRPAEAPGGHGVVEQHDEEDEYGGVGNPEVNQGPALPSPLPALSPARVLLLPPDRMGVTAGNVQVVVRLPPGVVRSQVNLQREVNSQETSATSTSTTSTSTSTSTHLYSSVLELIEIFLCRVGVRLSVGGGGDGDPGEPDKIAAN